MIQEQREIVAWPEALQGRVDALRGMQASMASELDALLPSLLDQAFRRQL